MIAIRPQIAASSFSSCIVDPSCSAVNGAWSMKYTCASSCFPHPGLNHNSSAGLMAYFSRIIRGSAGLFTLSTVTVMKTWAGESRFIGLLENSPFQLAAPAPAVEPTVEFRGYIIESGITMFSLTCPSTKGRSQSAWVVLDELFADYVVRSFDQATDTVQVEHRGKRLTLELKLNRVQPLQARQPPTIDVDPPIVADDKPQPDSIVVETLRRHRALRQANTVNHD